MFPLMHSKADWEWTGFLNGQCQSPKIVQTPNTHVLKFMHMNIKGTIQPTIAHTGGAHSQLLVRDK